MLHICMRQLPGKSSSICQWERLLTHVMARAKAVFVRKIEHNNSISGGRERSRPLQAERCWYLPGLCVTCARLFTLDRSGFVPDSDARVRLVLVFVWELTSIFIIPALIKFPMQELISIFMCLPCKIISVRTAGFDLPRARADKYFHVLASSFLYVPFV